MDVFVNNAISFKQKYQPVVIGSRKKENYPGVQFLYRSDSIDLVKNDLMTAGDLRHTKHKTLTFKYAIHNVGKQKYEKFYIKINK